MIETKLTPSGRVPGTLLKPQHEKVVHAIIRGASNREAGLEAGYKDGPGLSSNISRLCRTPEMVERLAEVAEVAAEDARIEHRWLLADLNLFRKASLAQFWKWDAQGRLVLRDGKPQIDFSRCTDEQLRCLSEFTVEKDGRVKIKLHDPMVAIDKLARHCGLIKDKIEMTGQGGGPLTVVVRKFFDENEDAVVG